MKSPGWTGSLGTRNLIPQESGFQQSNSSWSPVQTCQPCGSQYTAILSPFPRKEREICFRNKCFQVAREMPQVKGASNLDYPFLSSGKGFEAYFLNSKHRPDRDSGEGCAHLLLMGVQNKVGFVLPGILEARASSLLTSSLKSAVILALPVKPHTVWPRCPLS